MRRIVIGTRGSPLAMWQANHVRDALLASHPSMDARIEVIQTQGDKLLGEPQQAALDKGMFTNELEKALMGKAIDLAVHSLKDLPTSVPEGLALAAILQREDPADALVARDGLGLHDLPRGAKVFAGSLRRRSQLLHRRCDLQVLPIRGNVGTRLRKFEESDAHGIVFALAGLKRLGLEHRVTQRLEPVEFPPGCGQGAMALEIRGEDGELATLSAALEDRPTRLATSSERAFLAGLGGGCLMPAGAFGRINGEGTTVILTGMVASPDGVQYFQDTIEAEAFDVTAAEALGLTLSEKLRREGAEVVLKKIEQERQSQGKEGE